MSNSVIKAEGVSKRYVLYHEKKERYLTLRDMISTGFKKSSSTKKSDFWALDDVSFEVQQGDRVGIIGRNGAGKSTLLKILSRIVDPTKGRIEINGRLASLLEVGTGFHPELSGRENVYLNGSMLGMSKSEISRKFDEIVDFAEVEKFIDTPVKRYSSGMYVRLAFAVAAHLEPEILVIDEVLAVGDSAFQKKCLGKMEDVAGQGRTILFVSHQMESVQKLCNKGLMLNKGKLVFTGSINETLNKYLDSYSEGELSFDIPEPDDANDLIAVAKKVEVLNQEGAILSEVIIGKDFLIRVEFNVNIRVQGLVAAIGITSAFGLPIRTTWSNPTDLDPGTYCIKFKNDGIYLASGQYKINIGISSEKRVIHYAEGCGMLLISDVSGVINDERIINTQSGLIINQMSFELVKLN